ncbi:hypothetical protein [Candidatus Hodgkinia cicadicola]
MVPCLVLGECVNSLLGFIISHWWSICYGMFGSDVIIYWIGLTYMEVGVG